MNYLKAAQMITQHSLIQELMLYNFKLCYNAAEVTKTILGAKGESILITVQ